MRKSTKKELKTEPERDPKATQNDTENLHEKETEKTLIWEPVLANEREARINEGEL